MKQLEFTIVDPLGIHARPAGQLCKAVSAMGSTVKISANGKTADARRIMSVMGLAVKGGAVVSFLLEGASEEEDARKLEAAMREIGLV